MARNSRRRGGEAKVRARGARGKAVAPPPAAPRPPPVVSGPSVPLDWALLDQPEGLLCKLRDGDGEYDIGGAHALQIWALVGLAALGRRDGRAPAIVHHQGLGDAARFARAVGLEDVVVGQSPRQPGEAGRTVALRRFHGHRHIEPTAHGIATLVLPDRADEESRRVVQYVIVELLRNVVQHSRDPLGGVVAAQRMDQQQKYDTPCIQVAVADAGIGVLEAMQGLHPELANAEAAVEKAIQPHISGSFEEGLTGNDVNAGMGLFFIHEMAKLSTGRLLIATRGAGRLVQGVADDVEHPRLRRLRPEGTGFPGTLVAFELPLGRVLEYDGLIATIGEKARARIPRRAVHRWIRFDDGPPDATSFMVSVAAEDTAAAERFAGETLVPLLLGRKALTLDFRGIDVCTQSFLHALLFRLVRLAWAEHAEIFVVNARASVRSGIETVEAYALGG